MNKSLSEIQGVRVVPPKNGKSRTVSVPPLVMDELAEHLRQYPGREGRVFSSPEGHVLRHASWYRRTFVPSIAKAGLEGVRFHDLRHTSVALAVAVGAHAKAIQERLGHASIRTTLDTYGGVFPSLDENIQSGLNDLFSDSLAVSPRSPES